MKPLLATFAFVALAAAAIIAVASCSTTLRISHNQNVEMFIGDPNANPPKYVELKHGLADERALQCALYKLKGHGVCEITFLRSANDPADAEYCKHINNPNCKTDRVIKSAAAMNVGAGNSAANDPNLMHRVASPYPSEVSAVAVLLK